VQVAELSGSGAPAHIFCRIAELFDRESLLSVAFVKLRQTKPDLSVTEAESIAKDFVDKLKVHLATGSFTNLRPDSIVSSRIEEVVGANSVVPGTALFQVTHVLRDGATESERLKLRQSGDQWFVTPSEERMGISVAPVAENSDNPDLPKDNRPSPDSPQPN